MLATVGDWTWGIRTLVPSLVSLISQNMRSDGFSANPVLRFKCGYCLIPIGHDIFTREHLNFPPRSWPDASCCSKMA